MYHIRSVLASAASPVASAKAPELAGDTWTWTAIEADTKLILAYLVGGRDADYANASSPI